MIAIPIGLGLAYLLWGRKKEEPSSEESTDASVTTQFMQPMSQNMTPAQAQALGFATPKPALTAAARMAATNARVQNKMLMRASIGPGKPAGEPPAVKAAREAAEAAAKLGTPWPFKGGGGAPSPTPDIASWSAGAGASFDLTTKLK